MKFSVPELAKIFSGVATSICGSF